LSRNKQVITLRLLTDTIEWGISYIQKFKIDTISLCHCGSADMTAGHVLRECPQFTGLRNGTCQTHVEIGEQLYGRVESLKKQQNTLNGLVDQSAWRSPKKKKKKKKKKHVWGALVYSDP
jgi:hypothetical protein